MLKLYFAPGTCAMAAHIALEEAGANYEAVRLDFTNGEQKRLEFLAVNPKARVPALVTDHGVLTETPAILAYVAQCFPAAALAPTDAIPAKAALVPKLTKANATNATPMRIRPTAPPPETTGATIKRLQPISTSS